MISTVYIGSSSEDVEKLVTIPLERKIKPVAGIKKLNGVSAEGRSIITIEVDPDSELDEVLNDIKNAIDTVDDMPLDVKIPVITSIDNKRRGVLKVALYGIPYKEVKVESKRLRDQLERLPEVAIVELDGYREDEIRIELDPNKMRQLEVTIREVANTIKNRNLNLSAGKITSREGDIILRTVSEFSTIDEIKELVVRSNDSGVNVKIGEIADVVVTPEEGRIEQRSNGHEAVFLDIKVDEKADVIRSTNRIKKVVEDFFSGHDNSLLRRNLADDQSFFVTRRLNILKNNGIIGMVLVFFCLMAFLNFKTSLMTSLGAPIAFMMSFTIMESFGVTLNLISMFALILVLGMLVDDSIIVAEYYYQKLEEGKSPLKAAKEAAIDTMSPVLATILTTLVAFSSFLFMGGTMGKFLWPIPVVVIICLVTSFFECFFVLPSHLAEFCRLDKKKTKKAPWYQKLIDVYSFLLKKCLNFSVFVTFGAFFVLLGTLFIAKNMKFELFPGDDVREVYLQLKGSVGTPLDETRKVLARIEKVVFENTDSSELEQIKTQVGRMRGDHGNNKDGSHYGSLILYLSAPFDRERSTDAIVSDLAKKAEKEAQGWVVTARKRQGGPPKGKAVDIELTSDSLADLKIVSKLVHDELKKVPGVQASEVDFEEGKRQLVIKVDNQEAKRLGLSTSQIATELRLAYSGDELTEIRESDEDIKIKLYYKKEARSTTKTLQDIHVLNNAGKLIPITRVVKLEEEPGAFIIRRLDRKRIFSVSATLDKDKATPVGIVKKMEPKVKEILKNYKGMSYNFGGENEDTKESIIRLAKSFVISISLIFIILVVMFSNLVHPIVVMMAIPLGLIGVVWTFLIIGNPLSFMAFLGVVALVGVVVNDSIVLVTFINKTIESGKELKDAVHIASVKRFRPVVLTTFTTVAGLIPIAHPSVAAVLSFGMNTESDPFLRPMALSFAWGLLFASTVTLVYIPTSYYVFESIRRWFHRKILKKPMVPVV